MFVLQYVSFGILVNPIFTSSNQVDIADVNNFDNIQMTILDFDFILEKQSSSPVFSYNGTQFVNQQQDDCYYTTNSSAAFHLCNGVYGTFITENGTAYKIEPVENEVENEVQISDIYSDHTLIESDSLSSDFCGFKDFFPDLPSQSLNKRATPNSATSGADRVVEVVLYLDYSFHKDRSSPVVDGQNFLNQANQIYKGNAFREPLTLKVVAIIEFTSDLFVLESTNLITDFLPLFYEYTVELETEFANITYLAEQPSNTTNPYNGNRPDISFMLSHRQTLPATTVGLAYVGAACDYKGNSNSGVATRLNNQLDSWISLVIAHEIGHLLGSNHDGVNNNCASTGSVMAAYLTSSNPVDVTQFSTCSKASINGFTSQPGTECLIQTYSGGNQTCGNGFIDPGEECDPGATASKCCTTECKLKVNAQCDDANGPCCQDCILKSTNTICRPKSTDKNYACDVSEYCNGYSPLCPADTSAYSNGPCQVDGVYGACYPGGYCMTRKNACSILGQEYNANLKYSDSCDSLHSCNIICSDGTKCYDFTTLGITSGYKQGQTCGLKLDKFCSSTGVCGSGIDVVQPQNSTGNRLKWF